MLLMLMMQTPESSPCCSPMHSEKGSFTLEPCSQASAAEMLTASTCDFLNTFSDSKCRWEISSCIVKLILLDLGACAYPHELILQK